MPTIPAGHTGQLLNLIQFHLAGAPQPEIVPIDIAVRAAFTPLQMAYFVETRERLKLGQSPHPLAGTVVVALARMLVNMHLVDLHDPAPSYPYSGGAGPVQPVENYALLLYAYYAHFVWGEDFPEVQTPPGPARPRAPIGNSTRVMLDGDGNIDRNQGVGELAMYARGQPVHPHHRHPPVFDPAVVEEYMRTWTRIVPSSQLRRLLGH